MKPKNFEYVLALANRPNGTRSILQWRPFGKATLDEIINKHNEDVVKYLKPRWAPNQIEEFGWFMSVMNYDLSEVESIDLAKFQDIKFIFANLEELSMAASSVEHVKSSMNQARRIYYLAQISKKPPRPSESQRFSSSPFYTSEPEVIDDEDQLAKWLADMYHVYTEAISAIMPPPDDPGAGPPPLPDEPSGPSGGPPPYDPGGRGEGVDDRASTDFDSGERSGGPERVTFLADPDRETTGPGWSHLFVNYRPSLAHRAAVKEHRSLAYIARDVRDAAIQKGLSVEQTRDLARKAVIQERAIVDVRASLLANSRVLETDRLVFDCFRKPIEEISIDDKYLEGTGKMEVLTVKLTRPFSKLSKKKSAICSDLWLNKENHRVVLRSDHETLQKIVRLKDAVETRLTLVDLPSSVNRLFRK